MVVTIARALAILCGVAFLAYSMTHQAFRVKWGIAYFSLGFTGLFLAILLPLSLSVLKETLGGSSGNVYLLAWIYTIPRFSIAAGGVFSFFDLFTKRRHVYSLFVVLFALLCYFEPLISNTIR